MPDDRNRTPRRPGAGRRPPFVAGHRRRDREDGAAPEEVATGAEEPTTPTTDVPPSAAGAVTDAAGGELAPDTAPGSVSGSASESASESAPDAAGGSPSDEPQRIRVADTGWPERRPAADASALPQREPGATGGPGGVTAPIPPDPLPASGAGAVSSPDAPAGLTSPPYDQEPWAGLAGAAAEDDDVSSDLDRVGADPVAARPAEADRVSTEPVDREPADVEPLDADPAAAEPLSADSADSAGSADSADEALPARASHRRPSRLRRRSAAPVVSATSPDAAVALPVDPAPDDRPDVAPEPARSRWARVREPALIVALLAALVLGGLDVWTHAIRKPTNELTSSGAKRAAAAASAVAVPILSYDYRTIDQQVAKIRPLTTTTCSTQYANVIAKVVKPLAVQNQAVLQAQVLETGVRTASPTRVSVLVFAQLTSTNKASTTKKIDAVQLTLTMVDSHGRWLLAGTSANGSGSTSAASC